MQTPSLGRSKRFCSFTHCSFLRKYWNLHLQHLKCLKNHRLHSRSDNQHLKDMGWATIFFSFCSLEIHGIWVQVWSADGIDNKELFIVVVVSHQCCISYYPFTPPKLIRSTHFISCLNDLITISIGVLEFHRDLKMRSFYALSSRRWLQQNDLFKISRTRGHLYSSELFHTIKQNKKSEGNKKID